MRMPTPPKYRRRWRLHLVPMMTDVAAPFVAALSKADDAMKDKIKREVYRLVEEKYPDGNVNIESSALIIYGEK